MGGGWDRYTSNPRGSFDGCGMAVLVVVGLVFCGGLIEIALEGHPGTAAVMFGVVAAYALGSWIVNRMLG